VVIWSVQAAGRHHVAVWTLVIALALLSHVSTFATLGLTLVVLAVLFWLAGTPLRASAGRLLIATALAGIFSVAIYYGHFGDVYMNAVKVRGTASAASTTAPTPNTGATSPGAVAPSGPVLRLVRSGSVVMHAIGLPILGLAMAGIWVLARRRPRDPLALALVAWSAAFVLFFAAALMRVEAQFERYSLEFVQRVAFAASPAFVVLAAAAAAWAWRSAVWTRVAAAVILASAMAIGFSEWAAWWS
jgi:hypothetical protein